jgi:hypothetical protein
MTVTNARFGAWKARVEWFQLRLFKAKEGSRSIKVLAYLNIWRFANLAESGIALHVLGARTVTMTP